MDRRVERETTEQLSGSAPRSSGLNKALGKAMTKREVDLKLFGYSSIPENQEDLNVESDIVPAETQPLKTPRR